MSLALFASPIDYKEDGMDQKIKNKLSRDMLQNSLNIPSSKHGNYNTMQGNQDIERKNPLQSDFSNKYSDTMISDIHKNLKEDNDSELSNFYKTELNNVVLPEIKTNQYMLMDDNNVEKYKKEGTNDELLNKLDRVLEMFEEQREIKTTQKNEEIVLYCFLGVFTIYVLDSFVSIGKYTR
jgi:hypothetical protein